MNEETSTAVIEQNETTTEEPYLKKGYQFREEAFAEQRMAGLEPGEEFPSTRAQDIGQFRDLQAHHNPAISADNDGPVNPNPNQNQQEEGLTQPDNDDTSLLAGAFYPIGPSALLKGQVVGRPPVSGRVTSLAISSDGLRVYAGSANGGVWRSDNAGLSWRPTMNSLHESPTANMSDSLAVGAVVTDPDNPDRIFVGTGEGPGSARLASNPKFFGIGPLVSYDGGYSWQNETVASPDAKNKANAFLQMAMDPQDPEKLVAATRYNLMVRQPRNLAAPGDFKTNSYFWRLTIAGAMSSFYWETSGQTFARAWAAGGGGLVGMIVQQFAFDGLPYLVIYTPASGLYQLILWRGNGSQQAIPSSTGLPTKWNKNNTSLIPVSLSGRLFIVRYNGINGKASMARINFTNDGKFTSADIWTDRVWGAGWSSFTPVVIQGVQFFIAYNGNTGTATLQRWLPNGNTQKVWTKQWPRLLHLMSFNIGSETYLTSIESGNGGGTTQRFNTDGSFEEISRFPADTFPRSNALNVVPFTFKGAPRFLAYDPISGETLLVEWNEEVQGQVVWWQVWDTNLALGAFDMGYEWQLPNINPTPAIPQRFAAENTPVASGVCVARTGNVTVWFASFWDDKVYKSTDGGASWSVLGRGFSTGRGRISIAARPDRTDVVYAFTEQGKVYRNSQAGSWKSVSGVPNATDLLNGQGGYDLALIISPDDVNTIYLGGAGQMVDDNWVSSIYRCQVQSGLLGYSMTPTHIGNSVHADIHALGFSGNNPDKLWVGCDGGMFFTNIARTTNANTIKTMFLSRNCGLATLTITGIAQHPFEDAILYSGAQDNGSEFMLGSDWTLAGLGDGGHVVVTWQATNRSDGKVIYGVTGSAYRLSTDGGVTAVGARRVSQNLNGKTLFYPPYTQFPELNVNAVAPRVAYGANRPWFTDNFGVNWTPILDELGNARSNFILSAAFTTKTKLFVGTIGGQIYRYVQDVDDTWTRVRIDTIGAVLPTAPITGIAADPADVDAIYISLGGSINANGYRRVWHFDGTAWEARSGPSATSPNALMDVQFNTIVVSKLGGADVHLFAGSDIGVWHSWDGGDNWRPLSEGLPESAVFDLRLMPEDTNINRPWLLRAATFGRASFERVLKGGTKSLQDSLTRPVQLYINTTALDRGLYPAATRYNPLTGNEASILQSVDIKLLKSATGNFTTAAELDFCQFAELRDQSMDDIKPISGRAFMRVHNRGLMGADGVRVRLLMAKVSDTPKDLNQAPALPDLPSNLQSAISKSDPVNDQNWKDLGFLGMDGLYASSPLIGTIDFPLTNKGSYYLLALLDSPDDPLLFGNLKPDQTMELIQQSRKVAVQYFIVNWT